jgi:PAS domain-containing protein
VIDHELQCRNEAPFEARVLAEGGAPGWLEMFERAPALALRADARGVIERVNHAACELRRRSANALAGKPLAVFIAPEERLRFRSALWRSVASRAIESWPLRLVPTGARSGISCRARTRALDDPRGVTRGLLWSIEEDDPAEDLF